MRVAVTGASGRLGRAVVQALEDAPFTGPRGPLPWTRADLDLDAPQGVGAALDRDRPEVVVHTAAWTDVDGCARDPELALARNGTATGVLAGACGSRGVELLVVSTNEVFDGRRTDGRGYTTGDEPAPANPYGASKLAGERAAIEAFRAMSGAGLGDAAAGNAAAGNAAAGDAPVMPPGLGIARTSWLFGPPGGDFPHKILAAAGRAVASGQPLRVVDDEWGSPTSTGDLAEAIVELLAENAHGGLHHLVDAGIASRADWAAEVLRVARIDVVIDGVPASTWTRDSTPPRWGVLAPSPMPSGEPMRPWQQAVADQAVELRRAAAAAMAAGAATPSGSRY
jgi:dTDP-4-dehydrorhamnose reductase